MYVALTTEATQDYVYSLQVSEKHYIISSVNFYFCFLSITFILLNSLAELEEELSLLTMSWGDMSENIKSMNQSLGEADSSGDVDGILPWDPVANVPPSSYCLAKFNDGR